MNWPQLTGAIDDVLLAQPDPRPGGYGVVALEGSYCRKRIARVAAVLTLRATRNW